MHGASECGTGSAEVRRTPSAIARLLIPLALCSLPAAVPGPLGAQSVAGPGWAFVDEPFADLWFHGLAVVGFHGFGPMPLYDPSYALAVERDREARGLGPTSLRRERARLLSAFQADEAFEILHFVPLYFEGASTTDALDALRAVADQPDGTPTPRGLHTRFGASAVAAVLQGRAERRTLGDFVDLLREEWRAVVAPRRARTREARRALLERLSATWRRDYVPLLSDFLEREGLKSAAIMAVPALGAEGRFVPGNRATGQGNIAAVGLPRGEPDEVVSAALSSLVREICFTAVREAFAPFEKRFRDRYQASRANDRAATRCGELLLESRAPERLAAYRARFGLPPGGGSGTLLEAPAGGSDAAALEAELNQALRRVLSFDPDPGRTPVRPDRRQR